jgi:hypothetical protein
VSDQQQTGIGAGAGQGVKRLRGIEATGQRSVSLQYGLLSPPLLPPSLSREPRGLLSAHLRADQDRVEAHFGTPQGGPGKPRLAFTARCQHALGIGAGTVRLRIRVT